MIHRGDSCGAEGGLGHLQFTEESPHFQDPLTLLIVTESRLWRKIDDFPRKTWHRRDCTQPVSHVRARLNARDCRERKRGTGESGPPAPSSVFGGEGKIDLREYDSQYVTT